MIIFKLFNRKHICNSLSSTAMGIWCQRSYASCKDHSQPNRQFNFISLYWGGDHVDDWMCFCSFSKVLKHSQIMPIAKTKPCCLAVLHLGVLAFFFWPELLLVWDLGERKMLEALTSMLTPSAHVLQFCFEIILLICEWELACLFSS